MFGFLNVYKPQGKTSHDVVAILRKVTKIKQIGHTGTLDPFAEGVLPICIGKATRLIEYLNDDKAYIGTIQLGESTTTYDTEGEIVNSSNITVNINKIENILQEFTGEIEQIPPIYSAIKVQGKKLYEYARKGESVDIKPRKVKIHELKILDFNSEENTLKLYVACSKGTYIRSLANDIGEKLGTYGYLKNLVRVKAGNFNIENSIDLKNLDTLQKVEASIVNPLEYLNMPQYELAEEEYNKIIHGNSIKYSSNDGIIILTYKSQIIAIANSQNHNLKCLKVFCN